MKVIIALIIIVVLSAGFNSQPERYWVGVADYANKSTRNNFTFIITAKDKAEASAIFEKLKNKHIAGGMSLIDKSYSISEINFEKAWGNEDIKSNITYWQITK